MPDPTLADLHARVLELEAVQALILRLLSTLHPLDGVFEHYGATTSQGRACYDMLDEVATRARGPEVDRPTFGYFKMQIDRIFPSLRNNEEFLRLLIDTLRVERPAYRELHAYLSSQGWPAA